ncbi:SGNH/GDSL hydrolase family protein, partial [Pelagibacteraceae bacterium]|nr:SGNH/GDSL hydrolase family protein [Pelagibacteraceae bacterium]
LLNLITTPFFHLATFDVPARPPNYEETREYKSDFFKGMFSGKHYISSDEKGYRTNKKIDYNNKKKDTFRIFTVGGSTTEQGGTDNNKTWPNLLGTKLSELTSKNIEVVNVGMAGLRAEHNFLRLKRIQKYSPDLIIFMTGINDWNHHIVNEEKKYLFPNYEIKYNFKKSILFNTFHNINKQVRKKFFKKKKIQEDTVNSVITPIDTEAFLLPRIDSLNTRTAIKSFKSDSISAEYKYWMGLIFKECRKIDSACLFLDQPSAYKKNISNKLVKRLWMTPPNQEYTLGLEDLILISSTYNNWTKEKVRSEKLHFCSLSDKIQANTKHLIDDCHFTENGSQKVSDVLVSCINLSLKSILN